MFFVDESKLSTGFKAEEAILQAAAHSVDAVEAFPVAIFVFVEGAVVFL